MSLSFIKLVCLFFIIPSYVLAAGIPESIPYYFLNFGIFVGIIFGVIFYLKSKGKFKSYFQKKYEEFHINMKSATAQKDEATIKFKASEKKYNDFVASYDDSLAKAKNDIAKLEEEEKRQVQDQIIKQAEMFKSKLKNEYRKQEESIRKSFVTKVINDSKDDLGQGIEKNEQFKLSNEFIEKIQVVR